MHVTRDCFYFWYHHTMHKLNHFKSFKPLKTFFNQTCIKWVRNHSRRHIQTENLRAIINEEYLRAVNIENARSSFRTIGTVPFNLYALDDEYPLHLGRRHSRHPKNNF